jgi:hypothetical protein
MKTLTFVSFLFLSGLLKAQEQPTVAFECNCILGQAGVNYHVKVTQEHGPGSAIAEFSKAPESLATKKVQVEGTLVEFQLVGTDLIFDFVYPGPHTIVFSEDKGIIQKELDCSSPFTAIFTWEHAVCFSGKRTLENGIQIPERAIIYDRTVHPYREVSTVPFAAMYTELSKLTPK